MQQPHIIFVPGKNPKPPEDEHHELLWRTMLEGIKRVKPEIIDDLKKHTDSFNLIAWNFLYYKCIKDIKEDLPWMDVLFSKTEASEKDKQEANSTHRKLNRILYSIGDYFPFLLKFLPGELLTTAEETKGYFENHNNIACEIREILKVKLRPLLKNGNDILLIGHSLGSIIIYDTLWELSHLENVKAKVDFLSLGSPLGMNYVQKRLKGNKYKGRKKYPTNIKNWNNVSAVGDVTALDRIFADDFSEMKELNIIESIEDHCDHIYNYFRNEEGLNCHRSYGYLINSVVSNIIANWWKQARK